MHIDLMDLLSKSIGVLERKIYYEIHFQKLVSRGNFINILVYQIKVVQHFFILRKKYDTIRKKKNKPFGKLEKDTE